MTARPYLSVVIPTRDSARTLRHTLETVRAQEGADYEIVVADNSTDEATRELVSALGLPSLRYFRSGTSLAMSDNWEAGVAEARGEYVLVLGSDDGILPDALAHLVRLLEVEPVRAVRWEQVIYLWPDFALPGYANRISIPLERKALLLRGRRVAGRVANGSVHFMMLPSASLGVLHRDLLAAIRQRGGRIFGGLAPDVYSGFAAAFMSKRYLSLSYPLTVAGVSGRSNGISMLHGRNGSVGPIGAAFRKMNADSGMVPHPRVPDLRATSAVVADMYLRATEQLSVTFPPPLDRKALCSRCVAEMRCDNSAAKAGVLTCIRRSLDDSRALQRWFDGSSPHWSPPDEASLAPLPPLGIHWPRLVMDARRFGAQDVKTAADLAGAILGAFPNPTDLRPHAASGVRRRLRTAARIVIRG